MLIHLLIWLLLNLNFDNIKMPKPEVKSKKISLNIKQVATPPPAPKPKAVQKPVVPPVKPQPVVKPKVEKKPEPKKVEEVKRVSLDESKKNFAVKSKEDNNVTKVLPKPTKKVVKKKVEKKPKKVVKKKVVKKTLVKKKRRVKRKPKRSKDPLANMLMGSGNSFSPRQQQRSGRGNYAQKMINELYGSEFNTYTPTQKKYIKHNLSTIQQITQRTLSRNGYPEVAVRTQQQGTNVVAFYLHPNGDITGLRLKNRIGYAALDNNTLKVIRIAYKEYPLPNQKTKLIFYVKYSLY